MGGPEFKSTAATTTTGSLSWSFSLSVTYFAGLLWKLTPTW